MTARMYMSRLNFFPFARQDVEDDVGNDAEGNAFGNAVAKGHGNDGNVGRNGFAEIVEVDADDGGQHEEADDDQSRRGGEGRDGHEER